MFLNAWTRLHPNASLQQLGYIPHFFSESDPRPLREQIHEAYSHGGGIFPFEGFVYDPETRTITYPGDPPYQPLWMADFKPDDPTQHREFIVYPHAWCLIRDPANPTASPLIWRMD